MKLKLLALIALSVALVLAALRFLPDSNGDSAGIEGEREQVEAPLAPEDADLVAPEALNEAGPTAGDSRTALTPATEARPDSDASSAAAPGAVTLTARIAWPEGASPTEELQVYAFATRVRSSGLHQSLNSDEDSVTYEHHRTTMFEELESMDDSHGDVSARALASAHVQRKSAAGGVEWTAEIHLPRGRQRAFLHAAGGGFGTARAIEARLDRPTVTLEPRQRAQVRLEVTTEEEGTPVEGSYVLMELDVPDGERRVLDREFKESRYVAVRGLDAQGRTTFEGIPATGPLKMTLLHSTMAPEVVSIPRLEAGESRTVPVTMTAGSKVSGRVVDSEDRSLAGAEVSAAIPGRQFGFDDMVIRKTTTNQAGEFTLTGLPSRALVVRASQIGVLQSGRLPVNLTTPGDQDGIELVLATGKSIRGSAHFADGAPAAGLVVHASFDLAHMAGPAALGGTRGATNQATTDEDGKFTITGLGAGPFAVSVVAEANGDLPERIARADGVRAGTEDLALTLQPAARIAGTCIDDLGAPLAEAQLTCVRVVPGSLGSMRMDRRRATTNEEGEFSFDGLSGGSWGISLVTETHVTPAEIVVELDGERLDLEVIAMRSCTVSGIVLDPDGQPASGARVGQGTEDPAWRAEISGVPRPQPTMVNEEGEFILLGVAPGEFRLEAIAEHFAPVMGEVLVAEPGGLIENVTLRLNRGGTIEGICFDNEGKTAAGRMIALQAMSLNSIRHLTTDADGTFKETGLPPGRYQVIAMDTAMDTSNDLDSSGMTAMLENMKMATASVVEGETEFVFLGAPPASPVQVKGKVTLAGEPYVGAVVAWLPATSGMYDKMKIASTDSKGEYEVELEDSGDYFIQVQNVGGGGSGQQRTTEFSESIPEFTEQLERDFEMPGGAITGKVTAADGSPAGGVRLSVMGAGGLRTDRIMGGSYAETLTQSDGTYEVLGLTAGSYQVMAGGASLLSDSVAVPARVLSKEIQLAKNGRAEGVNLSLQEPGDVLVTVRSAGGSPVEGVSVFLRDDRGRHTELISMVMTNSQGQATLKGIGAGRYSACARGIKNASQESALFDVVAGKEASVDLLMEPGGIIVASLKIKAGGPVPVANVQILDKDGFDVTRRIGMIDIQSRTMNDGFNLRQRRVGPLSPGRYTVIATTPDGLKARRRVNLRAGDERKVTLSLR